MSNSYHPFLNPNPSFDEQRWIIQIRRVLEEDNLEQEPDDVPVSIFTVPKTLMLTSPEFYVPQQLALGPYHNHRAELYEMERYKLSAAKRFQKTPSGPQISPSRTPFHQVRVKGHPDARESDTAIFIEKTLDFQLGSSDEADDVLYAILTGFCKEVLPFKMVQELPDLCQVHKCAHLLDLLYNLIVPNVGESVSEITSEAEKEDINRNDEKRNFHKIMSKIRAGGLMSLIKRLLVSRLAKFLLRLPWKKKERKNELENGKSSSEYNYKPPLMEEIAIPSVTELSEAGVKFSVTNSGILGISFDEKTATFYLPMISLDVNTEVVLRNLVAYEACNASGPLVFARYTELMNGIIDSEEDAKVLREKGVVLNHLKSDQDVADLWNGMSKSVRLTKVPFLDKVIEDVNCYYRRRLKVRIGKFLERHVFGSWQSMTLLAALLLLFFMSLQAFCSLFGCARIFPHRRKMN
ncbi:hypothetical protein Sango_0136100 [Sesamum angolense]|uniref:Uncharacterized protein n=1 Tax=Sesamum angolense TaxID=2727404 RepID=A0AAE2C6C3_9LAMI|nr:hypothetical protein Sango_0136100 [Sesamum angolense]